MYAHTWKFTNCFFLYYWIIYLHGVVTLLTRSGNINTFLTCGKRFIRWILFQFTVSIKIHSCSAVIGATDIGNLIIVQLYPICWLQQLNFTYPHKPLPVNPHCIPHSSAVTPLTSVPTQTTPSPQTVPIHSSPYSPAPPHLGATCRYACAPPPHATAQGSQHALSANLTPGIPCTRPRSDSTSKMNSLECVIQQDSYNALSIIFQLIYILLPLESPHSYYVEALVAHVVQFI